MYQQALRPAWVEIDLAALDYNIKNIRRKIGPDPEIIGVIKGDAYGHGAVQCAEILRENGVRTFAVATLTEAIALRRAGVTESILLLGLTPGLYASTVVEYDLMPVFMTYENAKAFSDAAQGTDKIVRGLVAFDSGMGRIGWLPEQTDQAVSELKLAAGLPNFRIAGAISHFADSDGRTLDYARMQEERFRMFCLTLEAAGIPLPLKTIANSAAVMRFPESYYNAVRPGIILYGCLPSDETDPVLLPMHPVMSVRANIVHLKRVSVGTSISYGRTWTAPSASLIATVPVGYADGLPRVYSGSGRVLVNGTFCSIAGRICMDQFMIDVTEVPNVKTGDVVTLLGEDHGRSITADDIAKSVDTINYEITCGFGLRLPKVYLR